MGFSLILRAFFSFPNERQFIECQFFWEFRYSLFPHIDRDCDLFKKIIATFPDKDSKPVFLSPYTELVENFHQGFAPLAERILHLGRDLRVLLAENQLVTFQLFQVGAQSFIRYGFQVSLQLIEPHHAKLHQAIENHHFMFPADEGERIGEARVLKVGLFHIVRDHIAYLQASILQKNQHLFSVCYWL